LHKGYELNFLPNGKHLINNNYFICLCYWCYNYRSWHIAYFTSQKEAFAIN